MVERFVGSDHRLEGKAVGSPRLVCGTNSTGEFIVTPERCKAINQRIGVTEFDSLTLVICPEQFANAVRVGGDNGKCV